MVSSVASSPKKSQEAKSPKTSKQKSNHPAYIDMITQAVWSLKDRHGSTLSAIRNFIKKEHLPEGANKFYLGNALNKLLSEDKLKAVEKKPDADRRADRYKLTDSAKKELMKGEPKKSGYLILWVRLDFWRSVRLQIRISTLVCQLSSLARLTNLWLFLTTSSPCSAPKKSTAAKKPTSAKKSTSATKSTPKKSNAAKKPAAAGAKKAAPKKVRRLFTHPIRLFV